MNDLLSLIGCQHNSTMEAMASDISEMILILSKKGIKLNVELNNGRATMLGIIGNLVGKGITGQTLAE